MNKLTLILVILMQCSMLFSQSWLGSDINKEDLDFNQIKSNYKQAKKAPNQLMGSKMYERFVWQHRGRINEDGTIRPKSELYSIDRGENYSRSTQPKWWPLGPFTWDIIGNSHDNNPGIGRLNSIRVDPNNPSTIYVASAGGGIWKSIDGGVNWATTMDGIAVLGTSDIAIDPSNSDIVYAATGDRDGLHTSGIGVLKSTDGGATWNETDLNSTNPTTGKIINRLAINPLRGKTLFASSPAGIYKTTDGGDDFRSVHSPAGLGVYENIYNIMYHPTDTNIIYASGVKLLISRDAGSTWEQSFGGLTNNFGRSEIAVSHASPDVLYLLTIDGDAAFTGIWKSTDAGKNFSLMIDSADVNILGYDPDGNDNRSQGRYDLTIAVDPNNANRVITGGINLWYSYDGCQTIENYNYWKYRDPSDYTHADIHFVHYYNNKIYCASDGGLYVSSNDGDTWDDLSSNINIMQAYSFALDGDRLFYGSQDNGSGYLKDFNFTHVYGGDGMECLVHPDNSDIYYVESQYGNIMRTKDGGATLKQVRPRSSMTGAWVTPLAMNPSNGSIIYSAFKDVWKSTDGGDSWDSLSTFNDATNIEAMAISWSNPDVMYVSKLDDLYYTNDGGETWKRNASPGGYISDIYIDSNDPNKVWISCLSSSNQMMYSDNGGEDFFADDEGLPRVGAETFVIDEQTKTMYLGMEIGIYYKTADMIEWEPYNHQFPNVHVTEMRIDNTTRRMYAATYGRGMWFNKLDGDNSINELVQGEDFSIYPNPVDEQLTLEIQWKEVVDAKVVLWGPKGQAIETQEQTGKELSMQFNTNYLATGTYYLSFFIEGQQYAYPVSIVH